MVCFVIWNLGSECYLVLVNVLNCGSVYDVVFRFIEGDFDAYVKNIQQPYVWGGEPELLMASHVLKWVLLWYFAPCVLPSDAYYVILVAESHFRMPFYVFEKFLCISSVFDRTFLLLRAPIWVFMIDRSTGGLVNIAKYGEEYGKNEENPINVLFHGYGHYDILEIPSDKSCQKPSMVEDWYGLSKKKKTIAVHHNKSNSQWESFTITEMRRGHLVCAWSWFKHFACSNFCRFLIFLQGIGYTHWLIRFFLGVLSFDWLILIIFKCVIILLFRNFQDT